MGLAFDPAYNMAKCGGWMLKQSTSYWVEGANLEAVFLFVKGVSDVFIRFFCFAQVY